MVTSKDGKSMIKGIIFDLDGVLVDTAKYHYLAWKQLAEELHIDFKENDNELLKGVSRMRSLEIILAKGNIQMEDGEKERLASSKNEKYIEYLKVMSEQEVLPGILDLLQTLKQLNIKIALGSASKNAPFILNKLDLTEYFDAIVDGNQVSKAKPDPEVFLVGAELLGLSPEQCVVVEDAAAGIEAAKQAGMFAVGIGDSYILRRANLVLADTSELEDVLVQRILRG